MEIKLIKIDEINQVMEIMNDAKKLLGRDSLQWQQGYPNINTMTNDINRKELFGYYDDYGYLLGIVALVSGINDSYVNIYDGKWLIPHSEKDLVIHRIAVREEFHRKKIGDALMKYAYTYAKDHKYPSIKIDTHSKNKPMQELCLRNGYIYTGIIILARDEVDNSRLAYEKVIK